MGSWKDLVHVLSSVSLEVLLRLAAARAMVRAQKLVTERDWWKAARATHVLDHIEAARLIQSGEVTPELLPETVSRLQELYERMTKEGEDGEKGLEARVET